MYTYGERQFVAPDDPDAGDAAAVVFAKQDDTSKGIFSEFVQTLEHAWNIMGNSWETITTSNEHFLVYLFAFTITIKSGIIADLGIQVCSIYRLVLHLEEFDWTRDWNTAK